MTNKQVAESILTNVGGPTNISSVVHCATRLLFKLKDESKADTNTLNQLPGIIQVIQSAGQYQVVIGSHVGDVYQELIQLANLSEQTSDDKAPKGKLIDRAIDIISGIFTPYLGIIAGAGVLKGLLNLIVFLGFLETTSGAYQLLYTAADAAFYFMPIALAITAARKFKSNEFLALALAMTMLYPGFVKFAAGIEAAGGSLDFFGLPIIFNSNIGYNSTVIPIILAVWILSYVERSVRKVVPNFLRIFGVTLVTLLVMVPLTYIVIGPLGLIIGTVLGKMIQSIYAQSAILTGALLGGFWQVLVIFGMHWGLVPISLNNLATTGDNRYGYNFTNEFGRCISASWSSFWRLFKNQRCQNERFSWVRNVNCFIWDYGANCLWGNVTIEKTIYFWLYWWCHWWCNDWLL